MKHARSLVGAVAGTIVGCLVLSGCGSHDSGSPKSGPSAHTSSAPTAAVGTTTPGPASHPSTSTSAGTSPGVTAERASVTGKVASTSGTTAVVATAAGDAAIEWSAETTIIDTVRASAKDVPVGSCVLVLPEGSPGPTAKAVTAAIVRVIDSSPSCPRQVGVSPPPSPTASPRPGDTGGITAVGGSGVIGTVSAKSGARITLRSRTDGKVRVVTVTTTKATEFRKAGAKPRSAVSAGRCATVWGSRHHAGRLVATRIRMSDPVDGRCEANAVR